MKRIYYSIFTVIAAALLLASCAKDREPVFSGIHLQGQDGVAFVLPPINFTDFKEIQSNLSQFSDHVQSRLEGNDLLIEVTVTKNQEKCPFSQFSYRYVEMGESGLQFDYKYDAAKTIPFPTKKEIIKKYNQAENQFILTHIENYQ